MHICYWAGEPGLAGDYTRVTRLRKCQWCDTGMRCMRGKPVSSSCPQSENHPPAVRSALLFPLPGPQKHSEDGRPRRCRLETEPTLLLTCRAGSQHCMGDIREESISIEVIYLNWTLISSQCMKRLRIFENNWESLDPRSHSSLQTGVGWRHCLAQYQISRTRGKGIQHRPTQALVLHFCQLLFLTMATKLVPCLVCYASLAAMITMTIYQTRYLH